MTADQGLASPPVKLPKLSPTLLPTAPVAEVAIPPQKPRAIAERGTGVVGGTDEKEPAAKLAKRSSLPLPRTAATAGDEVVQAMRGTSPMIRGPRLRRRSGDFSLPVRYKYVVIPGNNSRAVLAAFRRRPWWGPARREEDPSSATVVRSSFVSRRKKSGKNAVPANKLGYSNKTFHLWWEMYASRSVIEGTNLDANLRQAVNHFEFNNTLVSKKGLWQSLRAFCTSRGVPVTTVVPQTFYLSGGAVRASTPSSSRVTPSGRSPNDSHVANGDDNSDSSGGSGGSSAGGDDRAELFAFCAAMDDDLSGAHRPTRSPPRDPPQPPRTPGSSTEVHPQMSWGTPSSPGDDARLAGEFSPDPNVVKSRNVSVSPEHSSATTAKLDVGETERLPASKDEGRGGPGCSEVGSTGTVTKGGTTQGCIRPEGASRNSPTSDGDDPGCLSTAETHGGIERKGRTEGRRTEGGIEPRRDVAGTPTWVVKPAASSNCGFGIQEVLSVVDARNNKAGRSGWVVQRYIERPLLVRGRKFDIRLFVLLVADPSTRSWRRQSESASSKTSTTIFAVDDPCGQLVDAECSGKNPRLQKAGRKWREAGLGVGAEAAPASGSGCSVVPPPPPPPCPLRAWCHQDAYVRTSSVRYSNDPGKVKDRFVHLTNNAVQRRSPSYGQDEPGNKLTLQDLQEWLDGDGSGHKGTARGWVENTLRPRMHELVVTSVAAAAHAGINKRGRPYAFELLGYDFMVDDDLRVWLIEVNSNPCLEFVCPLLQGMIVRVVEDTLSIALDSVFRPPEKHRMAAARGLAEDSEGSKNGFSRVYPGAD